MTVKYPDPFGPVWKFPYFRMIFTWEGGIFQSFWVEWCVATALSAIGMSIAYTITKDYTLEDWPDSLETMAEVFAFLGRRFQAAIGMMLGFYTSTMYGRYDNVRNREQAATRMINNIALRIAWKIQEEPTDEDIVEGDEEKKDDNSSTSLRNNSSLMMSSRNVRIKLIRLLNLSHAIYVGRLYEKKNNAFCSIDKLRDIGFATDKECDFLNRSPSCDYQFNAPLVWFQDTIRDMVKTGRWFDISSGTLNFEIAGHIIDYRNAVADLFMFKNEPVPLIYRQLVHVTVRMYVFILLLDGIFFEMRKDSDVSDESSAGLTSGSFWEILKFSFEYFLFVGWLTAADAMGNPFRRWADELEWIGLVKTISKSSLAIALDYGGSSNEVAAGIDQDKQNSLFVSTCDEWNMKSTNVPINNRRSARNVFTGF